MRVERPLDLASLMAYGMTSLLVAGSRGRSTREYVDAEGFIPSTGYHFRGVSGRTARSRPEAEEPVPVRDVKTFRPPEPILLQDHEITGIILDVLQIASKRARTIERVGLFTGQSPGLECYWLAVQYQAGPALPRILTIGLSEDACERILEPSWPTGCRVTCFDNGVEHVYQIFRSLDDDR